MRKILFLGIMLMIWNSLVLQAGTEIKPEIMTIAEFFASSSNIKGGICVIIGREDADLAISISKQGRLLVHCLYEEKSLLDKARKSIRSYGIYGKVSADISRYDCFPYAENLINLLIVDNFPKVKKKEFSINEILRVLCPLGTAYLGDSGISSTASAEWIEELKASLRSSGIENLTVINKNGIWLKIVKPWPSDIDEWTHYLHGADGNPVARDRVFGPPKHYQWISEPHWLRDHDTDSSISALVSSGGRIFYFVDEAPISLAGNHPLPDKWFLAARDAFNGVLLWKVPIKRWGWREWKNSWFLPRPGDIPLNIHRRIVAIGEKVYVTLGYHAPVSQLDAKTGEVLQTYQGTENTCEILFHNGILILTVNRDGPLKLMAIDVNTGKILWETKETYAGTITDYIRWSEMHGGIEPPKLDSALSPATDGKVVCFMNSQEVVCLDFKNGMEQWHTKLSSEGKDLWVGTLIVYDKVVLYADPSKLMSLSKETGELLWSKPKHDLGHLWYQWKDVYVIGGLVWSWSSECGEEKLGQGKSIWPLYVNGYDPITGEIKKQVPLGNIYKAPHHHRCYRNKATEKYILTSRRGSEFVDLETGKHTVHNWVRGACHYGMMPANGLQYVPTHPCICYIDEKLNGFNALAPEIPLKYRRKNEESNFRLETGKAYDKVDGNEATQADWPVFRSDSMRTGSTKTTVSEKLKSIWNVMVGSKISAPIVVGDRLFVSLIDEHHIIALSRIDGNKLWEFAAGGRIDSPPAYYRGVLLFGSADGWVYCVRASDGELVWRFRAGPEDRRICAFGQLESCWPVHGSILVKNGVAYFSAGRTSHLDGGIYMYGLDALTGKLIYQTRLEGPDMDFDTFTDNFKPAMGALTDIFVGDKQYIYMFRLKFDYKLVKQSSGTGKLRTPSGFLDDTYFKRTPWTFEGGNWGQIIVNDESSSYSVRMLDVPKALDPENFFIPGKNGYILLAQNLSGKTKWSERIPIRVRTMVAADKLLFIAGPPDVVDPKDPLGSFEGRKGGLLWIISAESGKKLGEHNLDSPPVFNGAAAANGQLFISTEDWKIICFGEEK